MKNFKNVVLAIFALVIVSCSSEEISQKLTSCAKATELGSKYRTTLNAYIAKPSTETCAAYRKIADEYVTAIKGCSTIASAVLTATEEDRKKYNCINKFPDAK